MQNFNDFCKKNDIIYYVCEDIFQNKSIKELKIKTVYPFTIIAVEDRGMSQCIDLKDKDKIFFDKYNAKKYLDEIGGAYS
jgi:hypothetical protein